MEHVSETRRRGRPPLLSPADVAAYRARGVRGTPRTYQNAAYRDRAHRVLGLDGPLPPGSPLRWLADPAATRGERRAGRQTILMELGRIADDAELVRVADRLCALRPPTTREAVRLIRKCRVGRRPPRPGQLQDQLLNTLRDYLHRYPDTTWADALAAVAGVDARVVAVAARISTGGR